MTNGDKIRSMTDEELAHFIYTCTDCKPYLCPAFNLCKGYKGKKACSETIPEWLKRECKNDD